MSQILQRPWVRRFPQKKSIRRAKSESESNCTHSCLGSGQGWKCVLNQVREVSWRMAENNAATNQGAAFDHERWLTLRAAYNQYKSASATLGALTAAPLVENSPPARDAIEAAAAEERAAFEAYIEARLALSESMAFPARGWPPSEGNVSSEERADDWRRSRTS